MTSQPIVDIEENKYKDCLACKITGATAFSALGAYALKESSVMYKIPSKSGQAVGLGVIGTLFISAGLYRLIL
ncbi:hypothetical protein J3Q64DRAFT_1743740 [Phycomyces blakesleeanus]|uniref:Distal membrane-arm assembly complex protein 1-like domain-containing protein n=2 Tax=Phycomyces blakesleeanus TaxID=4837 RepID=A0A162PIW7_PHYB8|nr:hypothetical protein PHYBLDRAFT_158900 [Phycomyces blakesleeanus NRRL 1555(-)]OAD73287.1 hypothetical protein PHYBLDRAFT_158900 [Phycomyces blakesleeanus NRRL 1555(-)]|eukprot:XP_018291327.1 hypothetical protein PHYBLDRAFT_158900 [Phycomyces blakesleeanus NRRL 1555(-)]